MGSVQFDYHYGNEAESYAFYAFPKVLFSDMRYRELSIAAKFMYSLMLDTFTMHEAQGGDADTFIRFDLSAARRVLRMSDAKLSALFKELDTDNGIGLIAWKSEVEHNQHILYIKRNVVT